MNKFLRLIILPVFFFLVNLSGMAAEANSGPVYELRIYTTNPGKMPDLLKRFREHTCAIFEHHGMVNVGYWLPVGEDHDRKLYYILKHASRDAAKASWQAFGADPEWQTVRKASEAAGPIVVSVESVFMTTTDYSPAPPTLTGSHVFELRTYTANEGKLDALDARFRDHTIALFSRHGLASVQYWHPTDADKGAGKTLIYILVHDSQDAAKKNWDAFHADPEWQSVRADSEKNGALLVATPKSVFLIPTDFSPLK